MFLLKNAAGAAKAILMSKMEASAPLLLVPPTQIIIGDFMDM